MLGYYITILYIQRPNLKNLSLRGLNLSRGSNMAGFTQNRIQCFKIKAGAQLKPAFGKFETRLKFIKFGQIRTKKIARKKM